MQMSVRFGSPMLPSSEVVHSVEHWAELTIALGGVSIACLFCHIWGLLGVRQRAGKQCRGARVGHLAAAEDGRVVARP